MTSLSDSDFEYRPDITISSQAQEPVETPPPPIATAGDAQTAEDSAGVAWWVILLIVLLLLLCFGLCLLYYFCVFAKKKSKPKETILIHRDDLATKVGITLTTDKTKGDEHPVVVEIGDGRGRRSKRAF